MLRVFASAFVGLQSDVCQYWWPQGSTNTMNNWLKRHVYIQLHQPRAAFQWSKSYDTIKWSVFFPTLVIFNWFWHNKMFLFYSGADVRWRVLGSKTMLVSRQLQGHLLHCLGTLEQGTEHRKMVGVTVSGILLVLCPLSHKKHVHVCSFVCSGSCRNFSPKKGIQQIKHWLILVSFSLIHLFSERWNSNSTADSISNSKWSNAY